MKNIVCLIDGFNLYHSIEDIEKSTGQCYKWLDLYALCKSFVYLFGKDCVLNKVYYFTSIAYHFPDKVKRHEDYISCVKSKGVEVVRGEFREKQLYCSLCKRKYIGHVEKQTDIALSSKLLELLYATDNTHCETFLVITGDSDLTPAIETANILNANVDIRFAFPYNRKSKHLLKLAPKSFKLRSGHYLANQFGNPVKLLDGTIIHKPMTW
ncbi:MAG: NYN domain-containing protein [Dehalococcoidales bacterium]|nr:NYN domain-containing protein [Dehalococcoidales bacterium]